MESVATEDLLLATLLTDDGSSGGTALSTVLDRTSGSGQRPSRQVEVAVAVERLVTQGFVRRESLGRRLSTGRSRRVLGDIASAEGDATTAREHWEAAVETFEAIGAVPDALETLETLVEDCRARGDDERAREYSRRARAVLDDAPAPAAEAHGEWVETQERATEEA